MVITRSVSHTTLFLMAENKFEKALYKRLSAFENDEGSLNRFVDDIVKLQRDKIDILDAFPEGQPIPIDVGILTRTKVDALPELMNKLVKYENIRKIECFPYGIPFPIWMDVRVKFSEQFQNRM